MVVVGIIGGSGVDDPQIMSESKKQKVDTPYGRPSDLITVGTVDGVKTVVVARHGPQHSINPSVVNYRANVWALKKLGVTHVIAPTACGSLREDIKPGDLVFIDQFIDRTTKRASSFYNGASVCHISMADPFCKELRELAATSTKELGFTFHATGTMVTIEGPRFSTRAESNLFRSWKADVINMTTVPEAVLAREAGLHYVAIAMATDYDCWHEAEEAVTVENVLKIMRENGEKVKQLLVRMIPMVRDGVDGCTEAIKTAVL